MAKLTSGVGYIDIDGKPYTKGLLTAFPDGDYVCIESQSYPNHINIKKKYTEFTDGNDAPFADADAVVDYFKSSAFNLGGGDGSGVTEAGELIFFLENEDDSVIAGYKVMDNPAQLLTESYVTQSTISDGALIQAWITDIGLPGVTFIPEGVWIFRINAYKTGGTNGVRIYNEMYKRAGDGTETLLGTTANSILLTETEVALPSFNVYVPSVTLLETDRLVTKTIVRLIGSGSNPDSVTVGFSGSTAARLSLPSQAVDITTFVRNTDSPTVINKIWSGSQAQYDALTPDANTLYFIV